MLTLLIVEASACVRQGLESLLSNGGMRVLGAGSLSQALVIARANPPDAVLLDFRVLVNTGAGELASIRSACPGSSLVMISTDDHPVYRLQAQLVGADGWLSKSATGPELQAKLQECLAKKLASRQLDHRRLNGPPTADAD